MALPLITLAQSSATIEDFHLRSTKGKIVSMADYPKAVGFIVIFTCNHCPFAKLYPDRLKALSKEYGPQNIPLLAISSTDTVQFEDDGFAEMVKRAKQGKYNFPYLQDGDQAVAKAFAAQKTPHAFVVWKEANQWVIKYNGAIDDNGAEPGKVTQNYVADAVEALLAGKPIAVTETKSIGCQLRFRN